jgi:hypothetical protein
MGDMSTTAGISQREERVAELIGKLERQLCELRELYVLDTAWLKAENAELADALRVRITKRCDSCAYIVRGFVHGKTCRHHETERKVTEKDTP